MYVKLKDRSGLSHCVFEKGKIRLLLLLFTKSTSPKSVKQLVKDIMEKSTGRIVSHFLYLLSKRLIQYHRSILKIM